MLFDYINFSKKKYINIYIYINSANTFFFGTLNNNRLFNNIT